MSHNNNTTAKEFSGIIRNAKGEVKNTFNSPFVVCNLLNKAAKGDFSKIQNCDNLVRENVARVGSVLKSMHGGRYPFDICVLYRAENGRIGTFTAVPECQGEVCNIMNGETVMYKGRALCVNAQNIVGYFVPTQLTITGIFNAFCAVAKGEVTARERERKQAQRESERAQRERERETARADKEFARTKKGIIKDYNDGKFGEAELADKLAELRAKYGK